MRFFLIELLLLFCIGLLLSFWVVFYPTRAYPWEFPLHSVSCSSNIEHLVFLKTICTVLLLSGVVYVASVLKTFFLIFAFQPQWRDPFQAPCWSTVSFFGLASGVDLLSRHFTKSYIMFCASLSTWSYKLLVTLSLMFLQDLAFNRYSRTWTKEKLYYIYFKLIFLYRLSYINAFQKFD